MSPSDETVQHHSRYLWLITRSYDWMESCELCLTEVSMFEAVSMDFKLYPYGDGPKLIYGSPEFWKAAREAYVDDDWKAYQVLKIDLLNDTMEALGTC